MPPGVTCYLPELRRQGIQPTLTAGRLHLSPPDRLTAEIAAVVAEHAEEIRAELEAEQAAANGGTPESPRRMVTDAYQARLHASSDLAVPDGSASAAYSDETRDLIAWFEEERGNLPAKPFHLSPCLHIVEPARLYEFIADWIRDGPDCRDAGVTEHLRQLREIATKAMEG